MIVLLCFTAFLLFSIVLNKALLLKFGNWGVGNNTAKGLERWTTITKPSVGGVGLMGTFIFSLFIANSFGYHNLNNQSLPLIGGVLIGFTVGFLDDRFQLPPFSKFIGQFLVAHIFYFGGILIVANGYDWFNYFLSIFWVVGIMNSINMLDNMDGITATASIVIVVICLAAGLNQLTGFLFMMGVGVLASLLGFLVYNWPNAKMYMGDGGSQFLGAFLSGFSVLYIWHFKDASNNDFIQFRQFAIPLLAFLIPIIDTTTVTIRRLMRGQSPFVGGRDHTTHQLAIAGLSGKQVASIFALIGLISIIAAYYLIYNSTHWKGIYSVASFAWFATILIAFQLVYYYNSKNNK